jgi:hypothetical protein
MNSLNRFDLKEISLQRLFSAIRTRLNEIPHSLAWEFNSLAAVNKENIRKYRGIHTGKRCFIVANGPSLRKTDLTLLENEITFGLNRIYLLFEETSFRPTYYVAVNELILEQWAEDISQLDMPKFLNWNRRSYYGDPASSTTYIKSKMTIKDFFQYDLTRPTVVGATVTFVALQLAFYMGFQTVYLIGLDHNYKEKGIPSKTETRAPDQDESHFHANYFPKGYKWQLPDLLRSEIEFSISRQAFEGDGREVLDATIGGKCQIFKKTAYEDLFD